MIYNNKEIGRTLSGTPLLLNLKYLNRHSFIGGATGSGKTTTVKTIIESLYNNDIATVIFDAKGDLSAISNHYNADLVDFYGLQGVKQSIELDSLDSESLSHILELSKAQADIFSICLLYARDQGYTIKNIKQLEITLIKIIQLLDSGVSLESYGYLSAASVKTLLRKIKIFDFKGYGEIFNASAFNYIDCLSKDFTIINALKLSQHQRLYAVVISQALKELYYSLDEVGDLPKPRLAVFIDEAHLLFSNAPKQVIKEITQVIKLIRSKGVAIFFISQLHKDIPGEIYSQLSLKIQHYINIATESDIKHLRALARAYTDDNNSYQDTMAQIKDLTVGQVVAVQRQRDYIQRDQYIINLPKVITSDTITDEKLKEYLSLNTTTEAQRESKDIKGINTPRNQLQPLEALKVVIALVIMMLVIIYW